MAGCYNCRFKWLNVATKHQHDMQKKAHKNALRDEYNWDYYPDLFLTFVALLRNFYQIRISYCKCIMPKDLKWGMLRLCNFLVQYL